MTPEATGPESLRATDSLAMALGRIEVDMGRFKAGQGIGRPYAHCDADLATIKAALLPPTVQEDAGWPEEWGDLLTHQGSWRSGLVVALNTAEPKTEDSDDASYWQHEIDVFDRVCASLPRLLAIARSGSGGTGAPEGWVLVPREPTEAMLREADEMDAKLRADGFNGAEVGLVFATMLAAAPPPAGAGK